MSEIAVGDVVQITPEEDENFGGCFMVVSEVKSWGLQGYCKVPGSQNDGVAYYRVPFDRCERIGPARWTLSE